MGTAARTTVKMAENGVVVIPKEVREVLNVDGEEVHLELEVKLAGQNDE